jgi:hypothetical protein
LLERLTPKHPHESAFKNLWCELLQWGGECACACEPCWAIGFYFHVAYTCEKILVYVIAVIYLLYGDLRITFVEFFLPARAQVNGRCALLCYIE